MSSSTAPLASPFPIEKRPNKAQGIDFPRAYRALIKGFIRAKTAQQLKTPPEQDQKRG
jgi:hypothetical protein